VRDEDPVVVTQIRFTRAAAQENGRFLAGRAAGQRDVERIVIQIQGGDHGEAEPDRQADQKNGKQVSLRHACKE
jgi:hypothetical protein